MKKSFILLVALCVMAVPAVTAQTGSGNCGDNLTWSVGTSITNLITLTISGSGDMYDYKEGTAPWYPMKDQIDIITIGENVTSIGDYAFYGLKHVNSISIPDKVKTVGKKAFASIVLDRVRIGSSVEHIDYSAFTSVSTIFWATDVYIQDRSTYSEWVFEDCNTSVKKFVVEDNVTTLPPYLCMGMESLTTLELSDDIEEIGQQCFSGCSSLTSVKLPKFLTVISDRMFERCSSLKTINLGERNITTIEAQAFDGCSSMQSITIPETMKKIDWWAFRGCSSLRTVIWNATNYDFVFSGSSGNIGPFDDISAGIFSFTFGSKVKSVTPHLCQRMSALTDVEIPEGVQKVGEYAFEGCRLLRTVTLPATMQTIGERAFANCTSLQQITCHGCPPPILRTGVFEGCNSNLNNINLTLTGGCDNQYANTAVWKEFNIGSMQGIDQVPRDQVPGTKLLRDGQLYLIYEGRMYDVLGREAALKR